MMKKVKRVKNDEKSSEIDEKVIIEKSDKL